MAEETLPSDKTPSGKDRLEEKEVAEEVNGVGDVHVMGNGENEDRGKVSRWCMSSLVPKKKNLSGGERCTECSFCVLAFGGSLLRGRGM